MALKQLRRFNEFRMDKFLEGKDLRLVAHELWQEKTPDGYKALGLKLKCIIISDNTDYGESVTEKDLNAGEQLIVKIPKHDIQYKKFAKVTLISPVGTIYGDYQNQLSVKADDITIINPN